MPTGAGLRGVYRALSALDVFHGAADAWQPARAIRLRIRFFDTSCTTSILGNGIAGITMPVAWTDQLHDRFILVDLA